MASTTKLADDLWLALFIVLATILAGLSIRALSQQPATPIAEHRVIDAKVSLVSD